MQLSSLLHRSVSTYIVFSTFLAPANACVPFRNSLRLKDLRLNRDPCVLQMCCWRASLLLLLTLFSLFKLSVAPHIPRSLQVLQLYVTNDIYFLHCGFRHRKYEHKLMKSLAILFQGVPPGETPHHNLYLYYLRRLWVLSTDLPMQNEVRVMLNPYDNDSRCIPPSFITTLSLTPPASHVL